MPAHGEKKLLPHRPDQLFDLVADIDRYPEFLPWCVAARVNERHGNVLHADLVIGFKMFREKFTSKVTLTRPSRIDVEYSRGPFRYLNNHWIFFPEGDGACVIDFHVDFEFRSLIIQGLIGTVFHEAVRRMVRAFETRAHAIYDEPQLGAPTPAAAATPGPVKPEGA